MYRRKPLMRFSVLLSGVLFLSACGQAGDLYLPEEPTEPEEPAQVDPYIPEPEERKPGRPQGD